MKKNIRVLVVDDEEIFAVNLANLLNSRGFQTLAVFDGFQAIENIRHDPTFDVVVLDVMMPGMDGLTTLEKIKSYVPDIGVIILTGHATLATGIQAIRKGAYDYLMKNPHIELYVSDDHLNTVIPFNIRGRDSVEVAEELNRRFGIGVRAGSFCVYNVVRKLLKIEDESKIIV